MKNFYIVENIAKNGVSEFANRIEKFLIDNNASVNRSVGYIDRNNIPEQTQCIITLGGDGTLMRVARDTAGMNIPLIGINLGHLGYLTSISQVDEVEPILLKLLNDEFTIENRMMLSGHIVRANYEGKKYIALNEIVIQRMLSGKAIRCKVYVNGEFLNEYVADGIIIATPTGSTAYNLSAGGALVEPSANMMIITPVCSHALTSRSIVVSSNKIEYINKASLDNKSNNLAKCEIISSYNIIDIKIIGDEAKERVAVFDGENTMHLAVGDIVRIKESRLITKLIKLSGETFLDNIRNKMTGI